MRRNHQSKIIYKLILQNMRKAEELLKKETEAHTQLKTKHAALTKKKDGSLATRDFTDDIYLNKQVTVSSFVEGMGSELFTNLLVVLPKLKVELFKQEQDKIMTEYYEVIDANETKRIVDHAKTRLTEFKEKHGQELTNFLEKFALGPVEDTHEWHEKALKAAHKLLEEEMDARRHQRMPCVIVPSPPLPLGVEDKEGNAVYRLVVYKE